MNPLLDFSGLPRFAQSGPNTSRRRSMQLIAENRELVAALTADTTPATWDAFVRPMEDANERLGTRLGHGRAPARGARFSRRCARPTTPTCRRSPSTGPSSAQNLALFDKYKALAASPAFAALDAAQRKIVENALRDFRLGGAELPMRRRTRFAAIQEELAALSAKFSENVLDATNAYRALMSRTRRLAGMPDDVLEAAREAAEKDEQAAAGSSPCRRPPTSRSCSTPTTARCARRCTAPRHARVRIRQARMDNTPLIGSILALRKEAAALLGYANFAEVSLVPKMARDAGAGARLPATIWPPRALPFAERDWAELREFARTELGMEKLEAWDVACASEKLRAKRYAFSDQEVKQYFPEPKVLRRHVPRGGDDLRRAASKPTRPRSGIRRCASSASATPPAQLVGQFYLDPYARETKRGGAWMDDAIARRKQDGRVQTPGGLPRSATSRRRSAASRRCSPTTT